MKIPYQIRINKDLLDKVKKSAKEMNVDFITACKAMQSASATIGNEKLIPTINELKLEFLGL